MSLPEIPNLIFSTRAARPQSGVEFDRDVVAESPGVPDNARALFSRCADITLTARQREEPVIFIFRPVRPGLWLFCRAVSLGLYRKSSHQLLFHGLLLGRTHLDALEGNPFLLDRIGGSGVFSHEHPGKGRQLPTIELSDKIAASAHEDNQARFEVLEGELADQAGFGRLFDGIRNGRSITQEIPRPNPDWAEWMLLHFHPYDRAEMSFHTWAIDGSAGDYDLSLMPPSSRGRPRAQGLEASSQLAAASERLRRELRPPGYLETLETYLLTYRSERDAPPVPEESALLVFRHALGEPLSPQDKEIVEELVLRGLGRPARAAEHLSAIWEQQGFDLFSQRFERLVRSYPEVTPAQLGELRPLIGGDLRRIWTALELVRRKRSEDIGDDRLLALWRVLVPAKRCGGLLELLTESDAAERTREALTFYVERSVKGHFTSSDGAETALAKLPYWPPWVAWTARLNLPVTPILGEVEELVAKHSPRPEVTAGRFRELFDLAIHHGEFVYGYRLSFQRELPALAEVDSNAQRQRLEELIRGLVEGEPETLRGQLDWRFKALRFFLSRPPGELLEGDVNAKTLLSTIRWALVFGTQTGQQWSVSNVLDRLGTSESSRSLSPSRFTDLAQPEVDADWMELFSDELLAFGADSQVVPSDSWRLDFERCFRLTWWHWVRDRSLEVRLARFFEIGSRVKGISEEFLQRVISESVPEPQQPAAWELSSRFRNVYQPAA